MKIIKKINKTAIITKQQSTLAAKENICAEDRKIVSIHMQRWLNQNQTVLIDPGCPRTWRPKAVKSHCIVITKK